MGLLGCQSAPKLVELSVDLVDCVVAVSEEVFEGLLQAAGFDRVSGKFGSLGVHLGGLSLALLGFKFINLIEIKRGKRLL